MNAVTVSRDGRIFVNFPDSKELGDADDPALAEIDKEGKAHPYPDSAWNAWKKSNDSSHAFVRVNTMRMGPDGNLWVVDSGRKENAPARLIVIDLHTNRVIRIISLENGTTAGSYVDDLRFHNQFVFLTDAGDPALIVVNLETGKQRRVLEHDKSTTAMRAMYADGKIMMWQGKELRIHADQLEVSPDGKLLYFQPASGPMYSIATDLLENSTISGQQLKESIELFADTPTTGGTAINSNGDIYLSDVNRLRILRIDPKGSITTFLDDKRLGWTDAMWITEEGYLWLPATRHKIGPSHETLSVIYKVKL